MPAFATSVTAFSRPVNPEFARDVAEGLTARQKTIPPSWLYDEVGSALFEVITVLPEYGLTRAEGRLLCRSASSIVRLAGAASLIVELGSGSGSKTRQILEAAAARASVIYVPIDISRAALDTCVKALDGIPNLTIQPIEATYLDGIDLALNDRSSGEPALLLFLGSTIGNFTRNQAASFLTSVRKRMRPDDFLLLGADLVKSRQTLLSAYDDPIGVTAAFSLNLLVRINLALDGEFDLSPFAHEARCNVRPGRTEMHLRSRIAQKVLIGALDLVVPFSADETIWTESSYKFRAEEISRLGERSGWSCVRQWIDGDWGFAETLFHKVR